MKNCILVTGAQGLVGSRFVELYNNKNELLTPELSEFNFLDSSQMESYLKGRNVTHVVNFAAYTDVAKAQDQKGNKEGICWQINVKGIDNLVKLFDRKKVQFIHISTDMVFPGNSKDPGPYEEKHDLNSKENELTWYGFTKAEGERIVLNYFKLPTIVRIIYPIRAKYDLKLDFLRKPLKLYEEGELYPLFDDQYLSVTYIDELCEVLKQLLNKRDSGIFHCSTVDLTTPFEIINYAIEAKYQVKNAVKSQSLIKFLKTRNVNRVRYPIFGGLKVLASQKKLEMKFSTWKKVIDEILLQMD